VENIRGEHDHVPLELQTVELHLALGLPPSFAAMHKNIFNNSFDNNNTERTSPQPQPNRPIIDLLTPKGWKADQLDLDLTLALDKYQNGSPFCRHLPIQIATT